MIADAHGPKIIDLFEAEWRVARIVLEQSEVLIGKSTDVCWQGPVKGPELRGGQVPQSSRAFPAL